MKLASRTLLVALAVSALAAPGALAKPTPVSPAMFRSADAATRAPAPSSTSAETQAAAEGGSSSFDWTLFGVLAIVGTGVAALTSLAYMLSRRVGPVAHP